MAKRQPRHNAAKVTKFQKDTRVFFVIFGIIEYSMQIIFVV